MGKETCSRGFFWTGVSFEQGGRWYQKEQKMSFWWKTRCDWKVALFFFFFFFFQWLWHDYDCIFSFCQIITLLPPCLSLSLSLPLSLSLSLSLYLFTLFFAFTSPFFLQQNKAYFFTPINRWCQSFLIDYDISFDCLAK